MKKVCIDPGHGGYDPGAIGPTGVQEKVVVMAIAKNLANILAAAGAEVKLTRENDSVPWTSNADLSERVRLSNDWGADVFVSIHANAFTSPAAKGMEVWTSIGQTAADPIAESIANALEAAFPDMVFRADLSDGDKDKEANFYVLRWTNAPAVLVELGFITNPTEEAVLEDPNYQAKVARVIAEPLARHLGLTLPAQANSGPGMSGAVTDVTIRVGGKTFPAVLQGDKTYGPVRDICEALGHQVIWYEGDRLVYIK